MTQHSSTRPATLGAATAAPSEYVFEAIGIEKTYDGGQVQALPGVNFSPSAGRVPGHYRSERLWKNHAATNARRT